MGGSSSHSAELQDKHVVIIGGGYGGISAALQLQGKCRVTLIDPKEVFHHCIGALRACTEDGYARKTLIPYAPTFGDTFKRGTVESIDTSAKKVRLSGGEEISYDFLIIATGSQGAFPGNISGGDDSNVYIAQYTNMLQKVQSSKEIVVIGGGAVGVEMAGEVATDYPDKKVILIHSREQLVEGDFLQKFRNGAADQLRAKGVQLVLGEKVTNLDELPRDGSARCTVKTNKGTEIKADLVFVCIGLPCNSSAYAASLSSSMMESGHLRVDKHLQVEGQTGIFAIGDCCNIDKTKMAYYAEFHGQIAAKNIQLIVDGKTDLKSWVNPGAVMILPVGRNGGVFQKGSLVFGSFLSRKLKSEHLFVSRYWSVMKQKVPKDKDAEI